MLRGGTATSAATTTTSTVAGATLGAGLLTVFATLIPLRAGAYFPNGDEIFFRRPRPPFNPFPEAKPPYSDDNSSITLYRGVYAGHPDIKNARRGMAVPMNLLNGHENPLTHNIGNVNSIFTSRTVYKNIAAKMAGRKGWGGIILTKHVKKYQVVLSPDIFKQGEILVPGVVSGAATQNARPSN